MDIMKLLTKIFGPLINPFKKKILLPLKKAKNWPKLLATIIRNYLKKLLNPKKITIKDYVKLGRYYVAKRLLVIVLLIVVVLSYFIFIKPPAFINKLNNRPTVLAVESKKAVAFSGKAKLLNENKGLIYEGALVDGKYAGIGKLFDQNGTLVYEGSFDAGVKKGFGTLFAEDGTILYKGNFENDVKHGLGESFDATGMLIYKGTHENGTMTGEGELFSKEGHLIYKGQVINGIYFGKGILYDNSKILYEGEFQNGKYSGSGTLYYKSGQIKYEGEFQNGEFGGAGKEFFYNGNARFEGNFKNGHYNGEGSLYYPNGQVKYAGGFVIGDYGGNGSLYNRDGSVIYEGGFNNGAYNGAGKLFSADGVLLYEGDFKGNTFNNIGSLYDENEALIYKGYFANGGIAPELFIGASVDKIKTLYGEPTQTIPELLATEMAMILYRQNVLANTNDTLNQETAPTGEQQPIDVEQKQVNPIPGDNNSLPEEQSEAEEPKEDLLLPPYKFYFEANQLTFRFDLIEDYNQVQVTAITLENIPTVKKLQLDIEHSFQTQDPKSKIWAKDQIQGTGTYKIVRYQNSANHVSYEFTYKGEQLSNVLVK